MLRFIESLPKRGGKKGNISSEIDEIVYGMRRDGKCQNAKKMSEGMKLVKKKNKLAYEKKQEARCLSDIKQFYENIKEVGRTPANSYILDLASQYCEDTKFFLEKKDYVTAFGAINYAHGLIDAFRKKETE